jgi:hypothetical protein
MTAGMIDHIAKTDPAVAAEMRGDAQAGWDSPGLSWL